MTKATASSIFVIITALFTTLHAQTPYTYQLDSISELGSNVNRKDKYVYNEQGLVIQHESLNISTNTSQTLKRTLNTYDSNDRLTQELVQQWNSSSESYHNEERTVFAYNVFGKQTSQTVYAWNMSAQSWQPDHAKIWIYTTEQQLHQHSEFSNFGSLPLEVAIRTTYAYNADGAIVQTIREEYDTGLNALVNNQRETYLYINDDFVEVMTEGWDIASETWFDHGKRIIEYENGNEVERTLYVLVDGSHLPTQMYEHTYNDFNVRSSSYFSVMDEGDWRYQQKLYAYFDSIGNEVGSSTFMYDSQSQSLFQVWSSSNNFNPDIEMSAIALPAVYRDAADRLRSQLTHSNYNFNGPNFSGGGGRVFYYSEFSPENTVGELAPLSVDLYPNPTADVVYIRTDVQEPLRLVLTSLTGKRIADEIVQNHYELSLNHLAPGVYLYTLTNATRFASGKIMKH